MKSALFRFLLNFQGKETKIQYISTKTSRTELYWKKSNQDFGIFATLTHFLMMTAFQRTYWQCFLFFIMLHQERIKHNFLTTKCLYYLRVSQIYVLKLLGITVCSAFVHLHDVASRYFVNVNKPQLEFHCFLPDVQNFIYSVSLCIFGNFLKIKFRS